MKTQTLEPKGKNRIWTVVFLLFLQTPVTPPSTMAQEVNSRGWPIPDLKGLAPYTIQVKRVDGVEKIVEKFLTPDGGHVARISGNGKVFAYAVDRDRDPPIDYLVLDPDGQGRFTHKFRSDDSYMIPDWVFR